MGISLHTAVRGCFRLAWARITHSIWVGGSNSHTGCLILTYTQPIRTCTLEREKKEEHCAHTYLFFSILSAFFGRSGVWKFSFSPVSSLRAVEACCFLTSFCWLLLFFPSFFLQLVRPSLFERVPGSRKEGLPLSFLAFANALSISFFFFHHPVQT